MKGEAVEARIARQGALAFGDAVVVAGLPDLVGESRSGFYRSARGRDIADGATTSAGDEEGGGKGEDGTDEFFDVFHG